MIRTIIDCARWVPSGGNGQPWEFVVVPPRRRLEEIIHHETYDMDKFRSDDQLADFVKTRTLQGAYSRKGGVQGEP
jgi:nitroreductase